MNAWNLWDPRLQKLPPRFFMNGDDPAIVYEDTIARNDDEKDVKNLFFLLLY